MADPTPNPNPLLAAILKSLGNLPERLVQALAREEGHRPDDRGLGEALEGPPVLPPAGTSESPLPAHLGAALDRLEALFGGSPPPLPSLPGAAAFASPAAERTASAAAFPDPEPFPALAPEFPAPPPETVTDRLAQVLEFDRTEGRTDPVTAEVLFPQPVGFAPATLPQSLVLGDVLGRPPEFPDGGTRGEPGIPAFPESAAGERDYPAIDLLFPQPVGFSPPAVPESLTPAHEGQGRTPFPEVAPWTLPGVPEFSAGLAAESGPAAADLLFPQPLGFRPPSPPEPLGWPAHSESAAAPVVFDSPQEKSFVPPALGFPAGGEGVSSPPADWPAVLDLFGGGELPDAASPGGERDYGLAGGGQELVAALRGLTEAVKVLQARIEKLDRDEGPDESDGSERLLPGKIPERRSLWEPEPEPPAERFRERELRHESGGIPQGGFRPAIHVPSAMPGQEE